MCFVFAYSDGKGVSVNLFKTRAERDAAVRELLVPDFEDAGTVMIPPNATAERAWSAYVEAIGAPDFDLAFGELNELT